ncbi:MAG: hypothetical protein QM730_20725 [Anaerolineales bacterium]
MMKVKLRRFVFLGVLALISCVPVTPAEIPTDTPNPLLLPVSTQNGLPVFEINDLSVDHEYCKSPDVFLSKSDVQGWSDDEVTQGLMKSWLEYFNTSDAPNYCRIDGYTIEKVYYDERTPYLPLEPKGDIMRVVQFSVKLVQYPNFWTPWAGEVDHENWLHTGINIAVFRTDTGYTMKFANP